MYNVDNFTDEEVKWTKPFNKNQTIIFTSEKGEFDTIIFKEVVMIKKVNKLLTGSQEDTIVPFPSYRCDDCGHVNEEFKLFDK